MPRVKRGIVAHRKHKKILNLAKGFVGGRSKLFKQAKSSVLHAGQYAYAGRKQKKRDFRRLWISQINSALKDEGISYSKFIAGLRTKSISANRKVLADLAVNNLDSFKKIVSEIK